MSTGRSREMDDLPSSADLIVLGTGLGESIVAAACSRIGKSVLHFDNRSHYGAHFAAFSFNDLNEALDNQANATKETDNSVPLDRSIPKGQHFVPARQVPLFSNVCVELRIPEGCGWTEDCLRKDSRKFNLDLAPRLLFARGKMVELLISSNIAKYAEFKLVSRVLTLKNGTLEQVPCSRADVFATKSVNVVEKRALMKLMTAIQDFEKQEIFADWLDKPFSNFLEQKELHLTDNLRHFIVNSIAMCDESTRTSLALANAKKFLQSLGRYGNSPFLCPIYGCGELPQCFCRLCAVFGGIYHLERKTDGFLVNNNDNRIVGVISQGKTFTASHVIANLDTSPQPMAESIEYVSRGIVIACESMLPLEKEQITLLRVPPEGTRQAVTVIEQGPGMMVCPKGLVVAHLSCRKGELATAQEDLKPVVDQLYPYDKQVWVAYFNTPDTASKAYSISGDIHNLFTMASPGLHLDYDFHIDQAQHVFYSMFPEEKFLPRAPDPEEIILDFEEPSAKPATGGVEQSTAQCLDAPVSNLNLESQPGKDQQDEALNCATNIREDVEQNETGMN
ncbi:rab proteins geranylgeranyltransferase component A 1-like isoform X1 [Varroa destructor]|uniref:Rab proteins geranylgeranyltransferase component A n=1 Tax=Varroa destructor TaxID=109461 RepID=A0A7M7K626_VARDE|nr:rab proteins geranylgeranyltransferase component A 1-like isoform X1 [Varroa destructor]XP_022661193.1 rab proteins geranylgeranyltransferase component A 1-like isoform X1 [Varroa destructor]